MPGEPADAAEVVGQDVYDRIGSREHARDRLRDGASVLVDMLSQKIELLLETNQTTTEAIKTPLRPTPGVGSAHRLLYAGLATSRGLSIAPVNRPHGHAS